MKATIWITKENEVFWYGLDNKSGFVNRIIDALMEDTKNEMAKRELKPKKTKIKKK